MGVLVGFTVAAVLAIVVMTMIGCVGRTLLAHHRTVDSSWIALSLALRRRHDLIDRLCDLESRGTSLRPLFEAVRVAQSDALRADGTVGRAAAEDRLASALQLALDDAADNRVFARSRRFTALRAELADVENRIAYTREYFNDAVTDYNGVVTSLPTRYVAAALGYAERESFAAVEPVTV